MMAIERITDLLKSCHSGERHFPPTDLYNEGWMLRLVLDWFSTNGDLEHPLNCPSDATWYSEALLPSVFLARYRGDKLAESWTHADGVIGHFLIGEKGDADLSLSNTASHLVVTEAKMFSKLSSGVTNAKYYNQAARNVACIAEVLNRAGIDPTSFSSLGFFVLAPQSQIQERVFSRLMDKVSIRQSVERRVSEYEEQDKVSWYEKWFIPALDKMTIEEISWEEIVEYVSDKDADAGTQLQDFYAKCLKYNQYVAKKYTF